jgi:prepilin-type N-terminal cleavage/methylation domain-containing protein
MRNIQKKAFTLIELLVVITIIWILATSATSIFTSQIQKARDSTRLGSIKALQWAVEQAYQDEQEFPQTEATLFRASLDNYIDKLPTDPKKMQPWNKSWSTDPNAPSLWYTYMSWLDDNWIEQSTYELSTAFEANWSITSKASIDEWNDLNRLEIWITTDVLNSSIRSWTSCTTNNTATTPTPIVINNWFVCAISNANQYTD